MLNLQASEFNRQSWFKMSCDRRNRKSFNKCVLGVSILPLVLTTLYIICSIHDVCLKTVLFGKLWYCRII